MVPTAGGRWFLIPRPAGATDHIALERTLTLIDRYGLVTRGLVHAEGLPGGFAATYRVLSHLEDTGRLHRVYAVEGVGGSQFATAGAVDALRRSADEARTGAQPQVAVLAATDPANAYGSAIDWPDAPSLCGGHLPGRRAGAAVVLVDGELVFYIERGGSALIAFADQPELLRAAAEALATYRPRGQTVLSTLRRVNGITALDRTSAVTRALEQAGFAATPQGLRLR
jgi:ATP-dependent Lhr-like helicase